MNRSNPAFVTGASGFIGRHLIGRLLAGGRPVVALCRQPQDLEDIRDSRLEIVAGALEEMHTYANYLNSDVSVFHLAATRNIPGNRAAMYYLVNMEATLALGRLALEREVTRFVHVSTALVFGPSDGQPRNETSDWDPGSSRSLYILSKSAGQRNMEALAGEGLHAVIVCPTLVYGPDHPSHPNRLAAQARRLLENRLDIVVGKGDQRRNLVAVEDVIEGMLLAEASGHSGDSYILGGEDCSHSQFNHEVLALAGMKPILRLSLPAGLLAPLAEVGDRVRRNHPDAGFAHALRALTKEWCYGSQKAGTQLGYQPRPLREGLAGLIASFKLENDPG